MESFRDSGSAIFEVTLGVGSIPDSQEGQRICVREVSTGQDLEFRSFPLIFIG